MLRRTVIAAAVLTVLASASAPGPGLAAAQRPLSSEGIVRKLNRERSALGMFANVRERPRWSGACRLHNRWMRLNTVDHYEPPGTPGYSRRGAWAGMHAVLGGDDPGWRFANPWLDAPIHLSQVYHPGLRETGAADTHGRNCMTTWPGIGGAGIAPGDRVWTFPVTRGHAPYLQRVWEAPFSPQERVGIGARAATGPYLYVWSESGRPEPMGYDEYGSPVWAPWAPIERLVGGSLTRAGGRPVAVRVIDDEDLGGSYVGAGNGWLLPVKPLDPGRTYQATVILSTPDWAEPGAQRQLTRTWSFKTTRAKLTRDGYLLPRGAAGRRRCLRMQVPWQRRRCLAGRPSPRPY